MFKLQKYELFPNPQNNISHALVREGRLWITFRTFFSQQGDRLRLGRLSLTAVPVTAYVVWWQSTYYDGRPS